MGPDPRGLASLYKEGIWTETQGKMRRRDSGRRCRAVGQDRGQSRSSVQPSEGLPTPGSQLPASGTERRGISVTETTRSVVRHGDSPRSHMAGLPREDRRNKGWGNTLQTVGKYSPHPYLPLLVAAPLGDRTGVCL